MEHDDASLPHGHIALLKTQDLGYVHMKRAVDLKVRARVGLAFVVVMVMVMGGSRLPTCFLTHTYTTVNTPRAWHGGSQKAEKLQSGLHFLMDQPPNKHTVFVDSEQEAEVRPSSSLTDVDWDWDWKHHLSILTRKITQRYRTLFAPFHNPPPTNYAHDRPLTPRRTLRRCRSWPRGPSTAPGKRPWRLEI